MANSGSARHRARECVLQGLYEAQLSGNAADVIRASLVADGSFANVDRAYFDELWTGVNAESDALMGMIEARIDRAAVSGRRAPRRSGSPPVRLRPRRR